MKFCYVDETGNSDKEPIFVMAGIIIDEKKLHKYSREVGKRIRALEEEYKKGNGTGFNEIKTHAVIEGKKGWNKVAANTRKQFCKELCKLAEEIPLNITLCALDFSRHKSEIKPELPNFAKKYWQCAAVQTALEVQALHKGTKNNKGKTVLIFDNNQVETPALSQFVFSPDNWIDGYYEKTKKESLLDEIVDTAFTIKSDHSGLVQLADCYAYIIRRYIEITSYNIPELWAVDGGELAYLHSCVAHLKSRIICNKRVWGSKYTKKVASIDFYRTIAPNGFIEFITQPLQDLSEPAEMLKTGT